MNMCASKCNVPSEECMPRGMDAILDLFQVDAACERDTTACKAMARGALGILRKHFRAECAAPVMSCIALSNCADVYERDRMMWMKITCIRHVVYTCGGRETRNVRGLGHLLSSP